MRTILSILLASICLRVGAASTDYVTLACEPSTNAAASFVSSYMLAWGQTSRGTNGNFVYPNLLPFYPSNFVSGTAMLTVTNLAAGRHYFAAYSISTNQDRSFYSAEVAWTNRNFSPTLRITGPSDSLALQSSENGMDWATLAVIIRSDPPLQIQAKPAQIFRTVYPPSPPLLR